MGKTENMEANFVNATQAWRDYNMPRSLLRELADQGKIERREKSITDEKVMILYSRADIERFINEQ